MYDMKNMARLADLDRAAPQAMAAFNAFGDAAFADGAVPRKYKELIAVAVALATQCPYCIEFHTRDARRHGADDAELAEAALVSAAIRAGGAITHAAHLFKPSPQAASPQAAAAK